MKWVWLKIKELEFPRRFSFLVVLGVLGVLSGF